ncbi:MAG: hypothetical protein WBP74_07975, partial [Nitrososphaeraceae archaeon]
MISCTSPFKRQFDVLYNHLLTIPTHDLASNQIFLDSVYGLKRLILSFFSTKYTGEVFITTNDTSKWNDVNHLISFINYTAFIHNYDVQR